MQNVHHFTSSAIFLEAIRAVDLAKARTVAQQNPWAVNASEPNDKQLTAAHIAVKTHSFDILHFLETLPHADFDLEDSDGESPLFYAISTQQFEMVKFFVSKKADLHRKTKSRGWSVVY